MGTAVTRDPSGGEFGRVVYRISPPPSKDDSAPERTLERREYVEQEVAAGSDWVEHVAEGGGDVEIAG